MFSDELLIVLVVRSFYRVGSSASALPVFGHSGVGRGTITTDSRIPSLIFHHDSLERSYAENAGNDENAFVCRQCSMAGQMLS